MNQCLRTFYLSHHKLLMTEFRLILNEKCTGCQTNDPNQLKNELCLLYSAQKQVDICLKGHMTG